MTLLRQIFACSVLGLATAAISGCTAHPAVPADASLMTTGTETAKFRPTTDGRVYIVDKSDHDILYQGDVDRGDLVEVDAKRDRITVGGRTVSDRSLADGHEYEILFKSHPRVVEERTVRYRVED